MFTGIIQAVTKIGGRSESAEILSLTLETPRDWSLTLGQSIAINGVCSTVVDILDTSFVVEYMPETLRKTLIGTWEIGDRVNLERSLRVGDFLDGHYVSGHIDTLGQIVSIVTEGDSWVVGITLPPEDLRHVVYKGSITLDGVSLTVSDVTLSTCFVSLIPYTLEHTIWHTRQIGDRVHIETDILAKYILKNTSYAR